MPSMMLALDPSELTQHEVDLDAVLPDLCDIYRPQVTSADGAGGQSEGPVRVFQNIPCQHHPARSTGSLANEIEQNNTARAVGDWEIIIPSGIALTVRDKITVLTTGRTFEVVEFDTGSSYCPGTAIKANLIE